MILTHGANSIKSGLGGPAFELDIPNFDLTTLTQDLISFTKKDNPVLSKSGTELIMKGAGGIQLDLTQFSSFSKMEFTVSRMTNSVTWQAWSYIGSGSWIGNNGGGYASIPTLFVYAYRYDNVPRKYCLGSFDTSWVYPPGEDYKIYRYVDGAMYYENRNGEDSTIYIDHPAFDFYTLPLTVRVERENGIESTYWNDTLVSIVDYSAIGLASGYGCNVWNMFVQDSDSSVETAITSLKVWT